MIRLALLPRPQHGFRSIETDLGIEIDGTVERVVARDLSDADVEFVERINHALAVVQERLAMRGAT